MRTAAAWERAVRRSGEHARHRGKRGGGCAAQWAGAGGARKAQVELCCSGAAPRFIGGGGCCPGPYRAAWGACLEAAASFLGPCWEPWRCLKRRCLLRGHASRRGRSWSHWAWLDQRHVQHRGRQQRVQLCVTLLKTVEIRLGLKRQLRRAAKRGRGSASPRVLRWLSLSRPSGEIPHSHRGPCSCAYRKP